MDLREFLILEIESMVEEFILNFGLSGMRTVVIVDGALTKAKASLAMATRYTVGNVDPALSGAEEARMLIRRHYLKPDMSDVELATVLSGHITRRVLEAGKKARQAER